MSARIDGLATARDTAPDRAKDAVFVRPLLEQLNAISTFDRSSRPVDAFTSPALAVIGQPGIGKGAPAAFSAVGDPWRMRTTSQTPLPQPIRDLVDGRFTVDGESDSPMLLATIGITTEWFALQQKHPELLNVSVARQESTTQLVALLERIRERGGTPDAEVRLLGGGGRYLAVFWLVFADFARRPALTGWGDGFDVNRDGNTLTFQPLPLIGGRR